MEELLELAGILAKHRLKKIELINNSPPKSKKAGRQSRYTIAFHALLEGKLGSDEKAAKFLGFKKADNAYYSFKHRFQEKLLNSLFHIDVTFSKYVEAEYQCSRLRHCVNMLLLYGCRNTAVEFAEKLLSISQKYNLAVYKMYCHKTLREHFAYTGDSFRYQKYNSAYDESLDQMLLENKAEDFLNRINVQYSRTIAQKPEIALEAFKYADEISEDLKMHDTALLQYYEHKLRGLAYQIKGEYGKSNEIWHDWESYLHEHPLFAGDRGFAEALIYQMDNYSYMSQYDEAKKCAEACLIYFYIDSPNRLIFLENYFLLSMRNSDYIKARKIFNLAVMDGRLHRMPITNQEKWKIFKMYLYYVEKGQSLTNGNEFDLDGFLKEIHIYKKDKAGFNVSMLIIQICVLIRMKPNEKPIDQMDALKLYKRRYLKTDVSYRVDVFTELFFELDKAFYLPSAIKKQEALLLKKLKNNPIAYTDNIEGMEVIPFERFWEMVKGDIPE